MTEKEKTKMLAENKRLRRENEYLRHRLRALGERFSENGETPCEAAFSNASRLASAFHKRTYPSYLLARLKSSLAFRLWDKTRFAVRGFFLATKLWSFLVWIFAVLGVGAQFLLLAGAAAILLPTILLSAFLLGIVGFFAYRKWDRDLAKLFSASEETVYLVFASKAWEKHEYFRYMLAELQKNGVVFLVFRSYFACGSQGVKQYSPRMYAVHISYYFSLKKHIEGKIIQIC